MNVKTVRVPRNSHSLRCVTSTLLWLVLCATSVSVTANGRKPNVAPPSSVGALSIGGPNEIEPTLVKIIKRRLIREQALVFDVEWWPESCKECVSSATMDENTTFQNHDGSVGELRSLTVGTTYRANALIFKNDSTLELSVLVLSK